MSTDFNASSNLEKLESSIKGSSRVPPEIFCYILEQLKDDKKALSSSSSVSRYWRDVSLPWLFAQISVPSTNRFTGFLAFVRMHPHMHLAAHVRQLRLHPHFELHKPISEARIRTFLSSAISGLPSLRSLSLTNVRMAPDRDRSSALPPADFERNTPLTAPLQRLSIIATYDTTCWTSLLIWLLSRYTAGTLELVGVDVDDDEATSSALKCLRNSVRVSKLVLDTSACFHHGMYSFFEEVLQPSSVQSVSISCASYPDIERTLSLMRAVGQNVTCVRLDLAKLTSVKLLSGFNWTVLGQSLAVCPCLERLHIKISTFSSDDYSGLPCHAVFTTVLPYASRTLRTLTIELVDEHWHYSTGNFETWDIGALAAYLTRKPVEFPGLLSVGIELRMFLPNENERLVEILSDKLSPLKDAGLLRMFCDDMSQSYVTRLGIEPLPNQDGW